MGALLTRLLPHTPSIFRRQALVQLFGATASAFQCEMPRLSGLSREQCLQEYARFTADRAARFAGDQGDLRQLRARLHHNAYRLGRATGWLLRVRDVDDVMTLAGFLYGILDIDFDGNDSGNGSGEITIRRCYFSEYYSSQVCEVMSSMDRGLLAGLGGGGDLVFTERITEGHPCCRARFTLSAGPLSAR